MPRIKSIGCKDFKRFTDLAIADIPQSARLVVLLGPNGCGKSSLLDAFSAWRHSFIGWSGQGTGYYDKSGGADSPSRPKIGPVIEFHSDIGPLQQQNARAKAAVYVRSAYRHEREFKTPLRQVSPILDDEKRPHLMASPDERIFDNYQRLVSDSVQSIFNGLHDASRVSDIRERLVGKIRQSLFRLFGATLRLEGLGDPWRDGTFFFSKGISKNYAFKNLSGGERAAFDLILDMAVKTEEFNDTVFAIDEPELHLHPAVHAKLLSELYAFLPAEIPARSTDTPPIEGRASQLWIASHSAGMLKEAFNLHQGNPGSVVFLDFNNRDFDSPVTISPATVDRNLWKGALSVALHDIADLICPQRVVICEGKPRTGAARKDKHAEFDAGVYRSIFATSHPETDFAAGGNSKDVVRDAIKLKATLETLASGVTIDTLIDRDNQSEAELAAIRQSGQKVLSRYSIENYLWSDEILKKLAATTSNPVESERVILNSKETHLGRNSGSGEHSQELVKDSVGLIYADIIKQINELRGKGSNPEEFAKMMLLPLITPETITYKELERDIFG